uniref:Putative O-antigen ligase n=1 Tax=viral metagenome TaxID=1070528 RepID=A0A6M3INL1_9ZZZZ
MVRVLAWKIGFAAFLEHWILGAGVGHWKALFYKIPMPGGNKVWLTAHNEYLQMLFELGIGFAIILAGYLFNIVKRMNFKTSILPITALIVIMVQSSANFVFHIAPTAMIALTWMAILERTLSEKTDIRSGVGEMRNTVSVQSA